MEGEFYRRYDEPKNSGFVDDHPSPLGGARENYSPSVGHALRSNQIHRFCRRILTVQPFDFS